MSGWRIAQVNVAKLIAPLDDPRIDDFRNALERINRLAEAQPGFIWRAKGSASSGRTSIALLSSAPVSRQTKPACASATALM